MKKKILIIGVILVAVVSYAVWTATGGGEAGTTVLGGTGSIESTSVKVTSMASGKVLAAKAKAGDHVKKGQLLFLLDGQLAGYQVEQAKAGVRAAYDTYRFAIDDDKDDDEIAQDKAQLDQAKIALKMAQVQAGYAKVSAPIDGVVNDVDINVGENALPGQALAVIGDVAKLRVSIYVPESMIGQVKVGAAGELKTDSLTETFPCKVTYVSSQSEFTPASIETKDQRVKLVFEVQLEVTDTSGTLKPGMPADVTL